MSLSLCTLYSFPAYSNTDDGARRLTTSDRRIVTKGAAWGVLTNLLDGSVGLVIERARPLDSIDAANIAVEWMRSTDNGQSWSVPITVAEHLGSDGKLYDLSLDGNYVVYQLRNKAVGQLPSGRIIVSFADVEFYYDKNGIPLPPPGENFCKFHLRFTGIYTTWSDDMGQTWQPLQKLDSGPIGGAKCIVGTGGVSPHWKIITMPDNTAMMSLYGNYNPSYLGDLTIPPGTMKLAGVIRSTDNGETWGDMSLILTDTDSSSYEETSLTLVENSLLAHVRTPQGNVVQYRSSNGGRNWSPPLAITEPGQHPGGAINLSSGNLLMTWGNRRPPYGAAGMLSFDGGQSWDYSRRVDLAWEAPNQNSGYANGVTLPNGNILVTYYRMPVSSNYRGLWTGANIYTVYFTEEQFREASNRTMIFFDDMEGPYEATLPQPLATLNPAWRTGELSATFDATDSLIVEDGVGSIETRGAHPKTNTISGNDRKIGNQPLTSGLLTIEADLTLSIPLQSFQSREREIASLVIAQNNSIGPLLHFQITQGDMFIKASSLGNLPVRISLSKNKGISGSKFHIKLDFNLDSKILGVTLTSDTGSNTALLNYGNHFSPDLISIIASSEQAFWDNIGVFVPNIFPVYTEKPISTLKAGGCSLVKE